MLYIKYPHWKVLIKYNDSLSLFFKVLSYSYNYIQNTYSYNYIQNTYKFFYKNFLWASRLWVGRRKELILGYVP